MDDPIVMHLVSRVLDSGCTPEDACRDTPELLDQVRDRLRRIRAIDLHVDGLFPDQGSALLDEQTPWGDTERLPNVPGHEVISVLGHGGMGVVYEARHVRLHRTVAIKMLLRGPFGDPAGLKRLLREAEAVAALRHPNIVQVHEVGDQDGLPYFTMELVAGGSLRERIQAGALDPREAASLVATSAEAMDVAHASGIVHRDLKPANVLFTAEGTPKIVDFGLARKFDAESSITLSHELLGTPSYMAPEQARGEHDVGPAADVYALGAVLYSTLTGRPPFRGDVFALTLRQVLEAEPERPSRSNPRVARDLETICLKCLNKDPLRRYSSARELALDLQRFLRGEPILARPVGRLERAGKWARRRPAHAIVAAGSVLALMVLVGVLVQKRIERGEIVHAAEQDLLDVDRAAQAGDWPSAHAALDRAKTRLVNVSWTEIADAVRGGERDLSLVPKLDAIRMQRLAVVNGKVDRAANQARADVAYQSAFQELGLADVPGRADESADRIRSSRIRAVLVSALDTWSTCTRDDARREGLLRAARLADPDPSGWRDRVRDAATTKDAQALAELVESAPASGESASLLLALAERLALAGADPVPFLTRVQQQYPHDFSSNFDLGACLAERSPGVAVRYFQTAAAVRPDSAVAQVNLGVALADSDQIEEAIVQLQKAALVDPDYALGHLSLGRCLGSRGKHSEAILELRTAVRLDPTMADEAHFLLARSLLESARVDDAITEFRAMLVLDPKSATPHYGLGTALYLSGHLDEAAAELRESIAIEPRSARQHECLGRVLLASGKVDEAIACLRAATRVDPVKLDSRWTLIRALNLQGKFEEARTEAGVLLKNRAAGDPDRPLAKAICDHCTFLVDLSANVPVILDGTRKPGNGAEAIAFADLFRGRGDPARAVAFYDDAFQSDAQLIAQNGERRLFDAARCAVLAGAVGDDGTISSGDEHVRLRNLACTWLRRDFAVLEKMIAKGTPSSRRSVLMALVDTKFDPSFAGVRDAGRIERLPADEQVQWRKLWSDVDDMSARTQSLR